MPLGGDLKKKMVRASITPGEVDALDDSW